MTRITLEFIGMAAFLFVFTVGPDMLAMIGAGL